MRLFVYDETEEVLETRLAPGYPVTRDVAERLPASRRDAALALGKGPS